MANIHTINEINNGAPLVSGNKLGDLPFNRYPSSQIELENQVACLKHNLDIALSSGIQLGTRNSLLMKNNESFSERTVYASLKMRQENSKMRLIKKRFLLQVLRAILLQNWKRYKLSIQE